LPRLVQALTCLTSPTVVAPTHFGYPPTVDTLPVGGLLAQGSAGNSVKLSRSRRAVSWSPETVAAMVTVSTALPAAGR
jgi:hypothetical protein